MPDRVFWRYGNTTRFRESTECCHGGLLVLHVLQVVVALSAGRNTQAKSRQMIVEQEVRLVSDLCALHD